MAISTKQHESLGESFSQATVARFSTNDITRLSFEQMIEAVRVSGYPLRRPEQLDSMDGDTVLRLVYAAREHCRQAVVEA